MIVTAVAVGGTGVRVGVGLAGTCVAVGQGANDARMLRAAALGICVLSPEGTAVETLVGADLVVANIFEALDLLEKPIRIVASLRE